MCEFAREGIVEDEVRELDRLLDAGEEYDKDGEPLLPKIFSTIDALEVAAGSAIPKSKIHRIRMLVKELEATKYRIRSTISRLCNARDKEDEGNILQQLANEDLLSLEQFKRLSTVENLTPEIIAVALSNGGRGDK